MSAISVSSKSPAAAGGLRLAPLKITPLAPAASTASSASTEPSAAGLASALSPNDIPESSAAAAVSSASTPTSTPSTPFSAPTPTSTASASVANSSSHHQQYTQQTPHGASHTPQPQHPPARVPIQPAPARKSLPNSSLSASAAAAVIAGPAPAVDKMSMASVISPIPGPPIAKTPISMTTKEWVIPPRPKPGRKPATDTPPTKRKAQNRAAQRAFRERRAARVGELEEQLDAEREEHERELQTCRDKIHRMEMDAQALQSRCEVLENMLDKERAERAKEVEALRSRLHDATQNQNQHPRQQSLPSLVSVPHPQHTHAPQPLRHHRPSIPSRAQQGRTSASDATTVATPTTHRPATTHAFSISQIISPPDDIEDAPTSCGNCESSGPCACAEEAIAATNNIGCGNCTLGSRCQCLEEVLNSSRHDLGSRTGSNAASQPTASRTAKRPIRSVSPSSTAPDEKRQRGPQILATETDFTAMFSRKVKSSSTTVPKPKLPAPAGMSVSTPQSSIPSPYSLATLAPIESHSVGSPRPEDRCGFCEDGTYCVCAEEANAAAAIAAPSAPEPTESLTLPSINSSAFSVSHPGQQTRTPPPSEGDAIGYEILPDGSVKLPSLKGLQARNKATVTPLPKPSGGCGPGGPGTCAQCISDPKSGLFCRSLAANFKKKNGESSAASSGCCGGGGPSGGCCKDRGNTNKAVENKDDLGLRLSCADAYKTLASHRYFNEAADDINTWLPLLKAAPKPREPALGKDGSTRTPIEVEAASIMGVLKGFDVRFGRGE